MAKPIELTYILGAGASFQSMPVVKTFNQRFDIFVNILDNKSKSIVQTFPNQELEISNLKEASRIAKILATELKAHQSFDTYFKKLFHLNDRIRLALAKKIIHLYFLWEHVVAKPQTKPQSDDFFWKQANIDKRYDALLAGILRPDLGECNLFCKTNFITWNYDLNLIESIKNYFYPKETFKEFLENKIKIINEFEWSIDDKISIINMNGYFYSNLFHDMQFIGRDKGIELLEAKITKKYFDNDFKDSDAELISFAWENKNDFAAQLAASKLSLSKSIVVIGYTFPLYNRLVDYKYFNHEIIFQRKLYIQDPNVDNIANDLKDNFKINLDPNLVKRIYNCDSFFVPSDIIDPDKFKNGNYSFA